MNTRHRRRKIVVVLYRCCWAAFVVQLAASFFVEFTMLWGWLLIAAALLLYCSLGGPEDTKKGVPPGEPVEVDPPVAGRWSALNSPADKVPSHGTHTYGQTYAIDVLAEPADGSRPAFSWWPLARPASHFPAFGAPVRAVADGTVVHAVDRRRDHLSRNSWPALAYLLLEGFFRDMTGFGRVTGNTLVLDIGEGTYALYAHLQRGSLRVREGERVSAGQVVGGCGNSGNSSEPHVHFQLMDGPDPDSALGRRFTWRGAGIPANGESFTVDSLDEEIPRGGPARQKEPGHRRPA